MKARMWLACGVAVVSVWTVAAQSGDAPARGWQTDFTKAEAEARRLGVPLVVHFYADWCGPCRQMEAEVLNRPELLAEFGARAVGVKVNTDHRPDLVTRFGISALPSDVVVGPEGRVLGKTTGYQERAGYIGRVAGFATQYVKPKTVVAATAPSAEAGSGASAKTSSTATGAKNPIASAADLVASARNAAGSNSSGSGASDSGTSGTSTSTAKATDDASKAEPVGLEGYSPVALTKDRKWLPGKLEFSMIFQGIEYRMATSEEFEQFKAAPAKFAPQYLGCDPMILAKTERAVSGNIKFGAFFRGSLFLFYTEDNRGQFLSEPQKYAEMSSAIDVGNIELLTLVDRPALR